MIELITNNFSIYNEIQSWLQRNLINTKNYMQIGAFFVKQLNLFI